jgi:hypothetical protein
MNEREVSKEESSVLLVKDKLNVFNNDKRFRHVNQPIMRKSDIVSLSKHILFQNVKISSKSLFKFASNYIADLCDHNPLYATELSTLIATAILKFDEETKESVEVFSNAKRENRIKPLIQTIKSDRMSESIGKMVDFVSSDSQLVLKAAAVAGFNGHLFSVSLLASMLPELMGNNDNTLDQWFISFNVMKITQNLVDKGYFVLYGSEGIQKKPLQNSDDCEGRDIVPDEFNNEYGYYSSSLRHYAYEMMLEDQKKYFHGKCAVFLETEYLRNSLSSPSHYRRIGCHWERAGDWTKAMCFYCHAGILYDKIGDYEDTYSCYALSYSMLGLMKRTF